MLDPVTQQYYLRARFYNPVIGRFTQEDTYYGDGLNLYQYCQANPVGYVDPSGHNCGTTQSRYNSDEEQHPKANAAGAYQSATEKGNSKSGSKGGLDVVQSKFNKLLNSDYYKNNPGYDCSEIATDFYDTAGQQGKIYRIEGKDGVINGYEYGKVYDFEYHEVYSDGVYIYDPRYQNTPVLKDDYFRALKEINPDGFDVFTIQ